MKPKETELYQPLCHFLEAQGYTVQAEVKGCDITAQKDDHLIIVEMKTSFNLKLVYQALERQSIAEDVYVAIPRPKDGQKAKSFKDMLRLLKRLEIGLMTVALDSPLQTVDVLLEPSDSIARKNKRKKERLQNELEKRVVSTNVGGVNKQKIMTAYRERSVELLCLIEARGQISTKDLREMQKDTAYISILSKNFYKWFVRIEKGVYALSEIGTLALQNEDAKTVSYYQTLYGGTKL